MNDLLLSELTQDKVDLMQAIALLEENLFGKAISLDYVQQIAEHCKQVIAKEDDPLIRAEQLINEVFIHQLFIDNQRKYWSVASHKLHEAIEFRIISPILKCIILKEIITYCGFECDIVFVPEKTMVRILCNDEISIIFDSVTGESLSWFDLDEKLADIDNDPNQQYVKTLVGIELIVNHLISLKNSLIHEQKFDCALKCIDIILALRPDDPIQRRDRGFLLHQLDCFKVAYDDYRYFVEQCPQDPAAQLLKLQLDNIQISDTVLH